MQVYVRDTVTSVTWATKELKTYRQVDVAPGERAGPDVAGRSLGFCGLCRSERLGDDFFERQRAPGFPGTGKCFRTQRAAQGSYRALVTRTAGGRTVGCGTLGSITQRIRERYWERHLSGPDVTPVLA